MPSNQALFSSHPTETQVVLHSALRYAQIASMIAPPVYLLRTLILRRRPFSVRSLMHTSIAWTGVGALGGAGLGYGESAVRDRLIRIQSDAQQVRSNDYSIISATLSALLIPAIFLRRASLPSLVLGGASIGLGIGVWAHLGERLGKGEKVGVQDVTGEVPGVGDAAKKA
ncbi:uncharacterized protein I303_108525 [Kwoniella dejecticola CBS 10117]|uniref:Uncharacterized protein n=1 Tax=Kwoniella dejecticola CBS 10117 TaxID=1296121 RepID=A0A1A5ZX59_9TREE|nr:uncharacterized protein I303_07151 [Kwoniella dejecticola CBS 10117]OBR82392.1 hypothetical protein I303_07151 [Kwoniella dejecticola CBS 10117]